MNQPARSLEAENLALRLLDERFRGRTRTSPGKPDETLSFAHWERSLVAPLSDFLSRPGKQFRARLVELSWQLAGHRGEVPPELPLLIEVIHAGSLIVDDIEDGSTHRRGGRALHLDYGVPRALNAANWLYFWPSDLLSSLELKAATELEMLKRIGKTLLACHEGQALDLCTSVVDLDQAELPNVVASTTRLKTGKLFELAAALGAIAADAPLNTVQALSEFGMSLGVGLQMLDDLGSIVNAQRCRKGHEDLLGARPTWPWAWAAERSEPHGYARLRALGRQVVARERHPEQLATELRRRCEGHGRCAVKTLLRNAFSGLSKELGRSRALDSVMHEIEAVEKSYG